MVLRTEKRTGLLLSRTFWLTLCLSCILAAPAYAQNATSTLVGLVTDTTNAVVPDAKITVTNLGTGISRTTTTTANGEYTVPFLNVGRYKITAEKTGFQTSTLQDVSLPYEQTVREDMTLHVGAIAQEVTV